MNIDIVIEGIIFQYQKEGGASRLFKEIIPRICELDESINNKFSLGVKTCCKNKLGMYLEEIDKRKIKSS